MFFLVVNFLIRECYSALYCRFVDEIWCGKDGYNNENI